MITPTVGRVVWFWFPPNGHNTLPFMDSVAADIPMAATIAYVHNDRLVNLSVVDHCGRQTGIMAVPLVQEGDPTPIGMYCQWMPYQKAVASGQIPPTVHAGPTSK